MTTVRAEIVYGLARESVLCCTSDRKRKLQRTALAPERQIRDGPGEDKCRGGVVRHV